MAREGPMSSNEVHIHLCRGCTTNKVTNMRCVFYQYEHIEMCPCIMCLVKVTCRMGCDDRSGCIKRAKKIKSEEDKKYRRDAKEMMRLLNDYDTM